MLIFGVESSDEDLSLIKLMNELEQIPEKNSLSPLHNKKT
jgi:hypothetical protein